MSTALALRLEKVSVVYNDGTPNAVLALDNLSLDIERGEKVIIAGGNGSGKSTLLKAIAGTAPVKSGRILIQGTDVTGWSAHKRARLISFVHQDPMLGTCPNLSVHENFELVASDSWLIPLPYRFNSSSSQLASIDRTGLPLEEKTASHVGMLSGGQRQALAVCLSLLREKPICLYDEFTSALDEATMKAVLSFTFELVEKHNTTILMVMHEHQQSENESLRRVTIRDGAVV